MSDEKFTLPSIDARTAKWLAAGAGVGSAALIAALLYAGRKRPTPPARPEPPLHSDYDTD